VRLSSILVLLCFLPFSPHSSAQVHLPAVFSDHAVLQRDTPIHVWGWSAPSEKITATFHQQSVTASADNYGLWELWLRPEPAGGPFSLRVEGSSTPQAIERTDLLVGDVWIASGQSNMQFPLKGFAKAPLKDSAKEIAAANHPQIRLLFQKQRVSPVPMSDQESSWQVCSPESVPDFSAVAYFFGREISEREHVPVGLIDATWGGTPAHAWMSPEGYGGLALPSAYQVGATAILEQGRADMIRDHYAELDKEVPPGSDNAKRPRVPNQHFGSWVPSALFNGMIAPYTKYTVKGVVWYQGESDHTLLQASAYARVFPALIADWRKQWNQGPLPFLFVQISSYADKEEFGMVRDAQRRSLQVRNTAMAVTLDVGEAENIHPADKQTVGARLALSARQLVYGESVEGTSPSFVQALIDNGTIRVDFSHADGLRAGPSGVGDFEIAGEDHKFVPAEAKLDGNSVVLKAAAIERPKYVRYGWTPVVTHFLYNAAGLPMGTFSSEP
jgi:sialate O-acetylesterase